MSLGKENIDIAVLVQFLDVMDAPMMFAALNRREVEGMDLRGSRSTIEQSVQLRHSVSNRASSRGLGMHFENTLGEYGFSWDPEDPGCVAEGTWEEVMEAEGMLKCKLNNYSLGAPQKAHPGVQSAHSPCRVLGASLLVPLPWCASCAAERCPQSGQSP